MMFVISTLKVWFCAVVSVNAILILVACENHSHEDSGIGLIWLI